MGHVSVVRQLLARDDVDFNIIRYGRNPRFATPLTVACHNGHVEVINVLAKNGIDVNFQAGINQNTPLMIATRMRSVKVVESDSLLARDDLDANIVDPRR